MTAQQKINLGTAPAGSDGDTVRSAFVKLNSNVDVLNAQDALSSATPITTAQALTVAHIGKRVNLVLSAAGTVQLPAANVAGADSVLYLRNTGTTVVTLAITTGSGDNAIPLSKLNPGESAVFDTDGVHTWTVLFRGRTNSDNEIVNGNCTVNGNEAVGGNLSVTGNVSTTGTLAASGDITRSGAAGTSRQVIYQTSASSRWAVLCDSTAEAGSNAGSNFALNRFSDSGAYLDTPLAFTRSTGIAAFSQRPTFAGKTPWDSGNFTPSSYAALASAPTFTGNVTTSGLTVNSTNGIVLQAGGINVVAGALSTSGAGFINATASQILSIGAYGYISQGGAGTVPGGVSGASIGIYCSTRIVGQEVDANSDVRLKENIAPITDELALGFLREVDPVFYTWKAAPEEGHKFGYIAQTVAKAGFANMLGGAPNPDMEEETDADGFVSPAGMQYAMSYDQVAPLLHVVLRKVLDEVDTLKARIAALEAK